MKRMWIHLLVLLSALLLCLAPLMTQAQEDDEVETETVEVTGQGIIFGNDKALATDKAIEHAKRLAVEQIVGSMVEASTIVQNFQTIDDKIYTRSRGYVKSFQVLDDYEEDGVIYVTIKATVNKEAVEGDLDAQRVFRVRTLDAIGVDEVEEADRRRADDQELEARLEPLARHDRADRVASEGGVHQDARSARRVAAPGAQGLEQGLAPEVLAENGGQPTATHPRAGRAVRAPTIGR